MMGMMGKMNKMDKMVMIETDRQTNKEVKGSWIKVGQRSV